MPPILSFKRILMKKKNALFWTEWNPQKSNIKYILMLPIKVNWNVFDNVLV